MRTWTDRAAAVGRLCGGCAAAAYGLDDIVSDFGGGGWDVIGGGGGGGGGAAGGIAGWHKKRE